MSKNTIPYGCSILTSTNLQGHGRDGSHIYPTDVEKCEALQRRLASFRHSNWRSKKSYVQLAAAGFRYTGESDRVECEHCKKRVIKWAASDDPLETHFRLSPQCPFMASLGYSSDLQIPKYKRYGNYNARLNSMEKLPEEYLDEVPSFEALARSGFFYQGSFDRMTCFQCGLVLRDWEPTTVPNQVHKQYGKKCSFIENLLKNENRKENFIQISRRNNTDTSTHDTNSHQSTEQRPETNRKAPEWMSRAMIKLGLNENPDMNENYTSRLERSDGDEKAPTKAVQPSLNIKFRPIGRFAPECQRVNTQPLQQQQALELDIAEGYDEPDSGLSGERTRQNSSLTNHGEDDQTRDQDGPDSGQNMEKTRQKSSSIERPTQLSTRDDISEHGGALAALPPLLTPIEQAVTEMGYSMDVINQAIKERHERGEGDFPDATSLCLAVMDLTENTSQST